MMDKHDLEILLDRIDRFLEALNRIAAAMERSNRIKEGLHLRKAKK